MADLAARSPLPWVALVCALAIACGGGPLLHLEVPQPSDQPDVSVLHAGAAEVDLTPPPGAPLFGYAIGSAADEAVGYRTRLKVRTIVLQGRQGGRVALVQADLGAISWLLHRKVAERVAARGISPDRILIAATHTHAGPGGYFGDPFYNGFGAGRPGFDDKVLEWLTERVTRSIDLAVERLAPAAVGAVTVRLPGASENRSVGAWIRNLCPGCGGSNIPQVDDRLTVLRVDRLTAGGPKPLAGFAVFAVHDTAVSKANVLYHGDVHGYAARYFAAFVASAYGGADGFVAAFANGAEGDVGPLKAEQSFAEAERIGQRLGRGAFEAFRALDGALTAEVDVAHAYRELRIPGGQTLAGEVCRAASVGVPTLAGAEDGPSSLRALPGIYEGRRRKEAEGCHGYKVAVAGIVQPLILRRYRVETDPGSMPSLMPLQVIALYDPAASPETPPLVAYATVPGEPTTAVGIEVRERLARVFGPTVDGLSDRMVVVGLANAYVGYFTSTAEYAAQHYEGSSTFYGPLQSLYTAEQLAATASRVRDVIWGRAERRRPRESSAQILRYARSTHRPGSRENFFGESTDCAEHAASWSALATERIPSDGAAERVVFRWEGLDEDHLCAPPKIAVVCAGAPLRDQFGQPVTDDGVRFEVRRAEDNLWSATFFPTEAQHGQRACRVEVSRGSGAPLTSAEFSL